MPTIATRRVTRFRAMTYLSEVVTRPGASLQNSVALSWTGARRALVGIRASIDVIVVTPEDVESLKEASAPSSDWPCVKAGKCMPPEGAGPGDRSRPPRPSYRGQAALSPHRLRPEFSPEPRTRIYAGRSCFWCVLRHSIIAEIIVPITGRQIDYERVNSQWHKEQHRGVERGQQERAPPY